MNSLNDRQSGFGTVGILAVVFAVLVIGGIGYTVFEKTSDTKSAIVSTNTPTPAPVAPTPQVTTHPAKGYEAMGHYNNDKYGISFYYPKEWTIEEVPVNDPSGPVPVEFAVNINVATPDKYKAAATIEISTKDYQSVKSFYEGSDAANSSARVTRTEAGDKGKQSTHYVTNIGIGSGATRTERFLYAVGDKTYALESVAEELNVQRDSTYWDKFNSIHSSLQVR